jgi:hypothetical protein
MRYKLGLVMLALCVTLAGKTAAAAPRTQEENAGDAKKTEDSKAGNPDKTEEKKSGNVDKPGTASTITLQVKISAEGKHQLPSGSRVELKGDDDTCKKVSRPVQNLETEGVASFPGLPACRVRLSIFVTGFQWKSVPVDLTQYKEPLQITVKVVGPPVVN